MANLVNIERVTVHSGIVAVLDDISLGINTGYRVGVVGANLLADLLYPLLDPRVRRSGVA